jgi:hypothetical protein
LGGLADFPASAFVAGFPEATALPRLLVLSLPVSLPALRLFVLGVGRFLRALAGRLDVMALRCHCRVRAGNPPQRQVHSIMWACQGHDA